MFATKRDRLPHHTVPCRPYSPTRPLTPHPPTPPPNPLLLPPLSLSQCLQETAQKSKSGIRALDVLRFTVYDWVKRHGTKENTWSLKLTVNR